MKPWRKLGETGDMSGEEAMVYFTVISLHRLQKIWEWLLQQMPNGHGLQLSLGDILVHTVIPIPTVPAVESVKRKQKILFRYNVRYGILGMQ
jgi:hypothetical protein